MNESGRQKELVGGLWKVFHTWKRRSAAHFPAPGTTARMVVHGSETHTHQKNKNDQQNEHTLLRSTAFFHSFPLALHNSYIFRNFASPVLQGQRVAFDDGQKRGTQCCSPALWWRRVKWFVSKTALLEGFTYAIEWSIHLQEFLFPSFAMTV